VVDNDVESGKVYAEGGVPRTNEGVLAEEEEDRKVRRMLKEKDRFEKVSRVHTPRSVRCTQMV
jgi:hypothetical protein